MPFEVATLEGWKAPELLRPQEFVLGVGTRFAQRPNTPAYWARLESAVEQRYVDPVYTLRLGNQRITFSVDAALVSRSYRLGEMDGSLYATPVREFFAKTAIVRILLANPIPPLRRNDLELPPDIDVLIEKKAQRLKMRQVWLSWSRRDGERITLHPADSWFYLDRESFRMIMEMVFGKFENEGKQENLVVEMSARDYAFLSDFQLLCFFYGFGTQIIPRKRTTLLRIHPHAFRHYNTQYHQQRQESGDVVQHKEGLIWRFHLAAPYIVVRVAGYPLILKAR